MKTTLAYEIEKALLKAGVVRTKDALQLNKILNKFLTFRGLKLAAIPDSGVGGGFGMYATEFEGQVAEIRIGKLRDLGQNLRMVPVRVDIGDCMVHATEAVRFPEAVLNDLDMEGLADPVEG